MKDLIERQAAIRIASGYCHQANVAKELAKLPSAQPERCEDCENFSKTRLLIPQPEVAKDTNVPSTDLISRQAALYAIYEICNEPVAWLFRAAREIEKLPSVQPDNSCDGCRYENADDGVLVPCGYCGRSHSDNYERRTDELD